MAFITIDDAAGKKQLVNVDHIVFMEVVSNVTHLHLSSGRHATTKGTLTTIAAKLKAAGVGCST